MAGVVGVYLMGLCGLKAPQLAAVQGVMTVCGMIRQKVVDKSQQPLKQNLVVEVMVLCEARLPLYACRMVRHLFVHFYEVGGWADDLAVAPPLAK